MGGFKVCSVDGALGYTRGCPGDKEYAVGRGGFVNQSSSLCLFYIFGLHRKLDLE